MLLALNKRLELEIAPIERPPQLEKYLCPACRTEVRYRAGNQTKPHFAHLKNLACNATSESESRTHLEGKLQLYNHFKKITKNCVLEKYIPKIHQTPDIYFEFDGKKIAIEFQCAKISLELIQKRTVGYRTVGISPIWIFHHSLAQNKQNAQWKIPKLLQMGFNPEHLLFLYNPTSNSLSKLSNLVPFSKDTYFASTEIFRLNTLKMQQLLTVNTRRPSFFVNWKRKRDFHLYKSVRFEGLRVPFYRKLYESGISTMDLPNFVGIPLPSGIYLVTPPIEWQGFIYLSILPKKIVSKIEMYRCFSNLIENGIIELAELPTFEKTFPYKALNEFINVMEYIGFLQRRRGHYFQINDKRLEEINLIEMYARATNLK